MRLLFKINFKVLLYKHAGITILRKLFLIFRALVQQ
jgi:hypothetical protein